MVRNPFTGPGAIIQDRGKLGVYKQDFNAHQDGTGFRHKANTIDIDPILPKFTGVTVQDVLEELDTFLATGVVYYTIGDGVNSFGSVNVGDTGTATIEDCFTAALASSNIGTNGGVIFLKSGQYNFVSSITLPAGVSVFGEIGGTVINATTGQPIFITTECPSTTVGGTVALSVTGYKVTKFFNLTFFDNLGNSTPVLGSAGFIKCRRGSNVEVERCSMFGKSNAANSATTKYCIYYDEITASTYDSLLVVKNNYFYGVQTVVDFFTDIAYDNKLEFKNNRALFCGQIGGTTNRELSAVTFVACDAKLNNNDFTIGINSTLQYSTSCFCCFSPGAVIKNVTVIGNTLHSVQETLTDLQDTRNNLLREDSSGLKYIRSIVTGNIIGSACDTNWNIVIGDGSNTVGDINGEFALQQFLINYVIDKSNLSHGITTIFIKPGSYTINDNNFNSFSASFDYKLVGLADNGNYPSIFLDYTTPAADENIVYFGSHIENLYFYSSNYYYRIYLNGANTSPDSRINYSINVVARNCSFHNCGIGCITAVV
jgi:hypothetical protein